MNHRLALLMLAALPQIAGAHPASGRQILEESKLASGGRAWDSVKSLEVKGTLAVAGMSGRIVSYQDLSAARFRTDFSVGPMTRSTGFDGKTGWTLDSNGDVAPHDSPAERRADRTQAYLAARDYWFPRRWAAVVAREHTVVRGPSSYEVVRVIPAGGLPFRLWIDAATRRISRIVVGGKFHEEITSYGDYREVHGLALPFRISLGSEHAGHGQTIAVTQVAVNPPVAAQLYDVPRQHLADYSFASGADGASIPMRFVGNHIYFPVEIGGRRLQFGLDTGGMNIIAAGAARAIGLRTEGAAHATGAGARRIAVSFAKVPAVSVGSKLTLRDQLFVVAPLSGIGAVEGTRLDGVLGYELFERFVIRIDYANDRLRILRPADLDTRAAGTSVPFTYDGRMPQVAGSLDGLSGRFDVDTGSRDALSINSPFVKAHDLLRRYRATARTVTGWGAGGAAYGRLARAREFRIGDIAVQCPVIELSTQTAGTDAERSVAGVIGNGILRRFTVTFDYAKQVIYLRRNRSYTSPFTYDRAGMWVNRRKRSFIVQSVMEGGPAQRAGLRAGDLIVSVDGRPAARVPLPDFRRMLAASPPGTRLHLEIVRAGKARALAVVLRNLVPPCGNRSTVPLAAARSRALTSTSRPFR